MPVPPGGGAAGVSVAEVKNIWLPAEPRLDPVKLTVAPEPAARVKAPKFNVLPAPAVTATVEPPAPSVNDPSVCVDADEPLAMKLSVPPLSAIGAAALARLAFPA